MMKINFMRASKRRAFMLLEMIFALIIILFLCYIVLKFYITKPIINNKTQNILSKEGVDSSSPRAIIDSTRGKIEEINKKTLDRVKQLEY